VMRALAFGDLGLVRFFTDLTGTGVEKQKG
jgi:hypothetical protein